MFLKIFEITVPRTKEVLGPKSKMLLKEKFMIILHSLQDQI